MRRKVKPRYAQSGISIIIQAIIADDRAILLRLEARRRSREVYQVKQLKYIYQYTYTTSHHNPTVSPHLLFSIDS